MQTKGEAKDPSAVNSVNPWDLALPPKVSGIIDKLYKAQITAKLSGVPVPELSPAPAPVAPPVPSETPAAPAVAPRRFRLGEDGNLTEVTQ